tara:strand:+ start:284 stop:529 length:246 start_codon:yes stop_codon:yes gene_type:complete
MDNVFKYFNGFFKGLTGLIMTILGLAIVATLLYGQEALMDDLNIDVIGNIVGVIKGLANQGFVGLIGILIVWNLISGSTTK